MLDTNQYFHILMKRVEFLNDRLIKSNNSPIILQERDALNWIIEEYMDMLKRQVRN